MSSHKLGSIVVKMISRISERSSLIIVCSPTTATNADNVIEHKIILVIIESSHSSITYLSIAQLDSWLFRTQVEQSKVKYHVKKYIHR